LYLNGTEKGIVNNCCFPSTVAPAYAPAGKVSFCEIRWCLGEGVLLGIIGKHTEPARQEAYFKMNDKAVLMPAFHRRLTLSNANSKLGISGGPMAFVVLGCISLEQKWLFQPFRHHTSTLSITFEEYLEADTPLS
jgi:hypothetical protein